MTCESEPDSPERKNSGIVGKNDSGLIIFRPIPRESSGPVMYHKNLPQKVSPTLPPNGTNNEIKEDADEETVSIGPIGQGARRRVVKDPTRNLNRSVAPASG